MTFFELSLVFEQLEQTSKRLELIDLLSGLYLKISEAVEAKQITYLLQGRVAAFYEPVEFGVAGKLIERAVAEGVGVELSKVQELNKKLGDLGRTIEQLIISLQGGSQRNNVPARGIRVKELRVNADGLEIGEVFARLQSIASEGGDGSIERKVGILAELVRGADALSAKYIIRIASGTLRLGVGDVTVLEAMALAKLGSRKYRPELEWVYNEISDLGEIAFALFQSVHDEGAGVSASRLANVKKLGVQVGRPLRSQLCERLPDAQKTIEKMGVVVSQLKFDGFRTQMHLDRKSGVVKLYSRNLEETTAAFPELVAALWEQVDADSVILDSEAIAYHTESDEFLPFQETTKRRRKHDVDEMAVKLPLKAFLFDILYLNGKSLLELPVVDRLRILDSVIGENSKLKKPSSKQISNDKSQSISREKMLDSLVVSESRVIERAEDLQLMLDDALSRGLEGLVIKKIDSPYEAGARNFNWVKLKHTASEHMKDTIDCVVLGYILGRGKRADFGVGALLVGVYDQERDVFVSISKIGTGLTDLEWVRVRESCDALQSAIRPARVESEIVPSVWVEPGVVIEVLCDEITRSPLHTAGRVDGEPGYALRFPRLISFREDKWPEDATSVSEIRDLYAMQYQNQ